MKLFRKSITTSSAPPEKAERAHTKLLTWLERMKIVIKLTLIGIVTFTAALAISLWWFWDTPLATPISSSTVFRFLAEPRSPHSSNKVIYGFLPYWNLKKATLQPEITHLGYFSLTIGADGSLLTREEDYTEPGYAGLQSDELLDLSNQMQANGGTVEIVVSQFNGDDIVSFLSSKPAQEKFIASLDDMILAYPISGVNIDIEYAGTNSESLRDNLSAFMKDLRTHLDTRYDSVQLSIDMYAGASTNQSIWDIAAIAPNVDYIVVMAYDFHRRTSPLAGPVAPLFGGKEMWDSDINQHLQEFLTIVPAEKLLLGIPFYGYEWQTTSRDPQSHTFPDTGSTAQITKVKELLERKDELQVEEGWNEEALSPYLSYVENDLTYVLYYENSRSISYKLDYVNQLDLGGVAIWALGYEGGSRELWDVINRKVQ
jgi:spore germination protein YaaH